MSFTKTTLCFFLVIMVFHSIDYRYPCFSSSPFLLTQIPGHMAGTPLPLSTTVHAFIFVATLPSMKGVLGMHQCFVTLTREKVLWDNYNVVCIYSPWARFGFLAIASGLSHLEGRRSVRTDRYLRRLHRKIPVVRSLPIGEIT